MVNKIIIIGNLGKDPEIKQLDNGSMVGKFSVATNENYKDKAGEWQTITEWHNVVVWRKLAEKAQSSLKKGSLVYIEGKLSTRKWQDDKGTDRYSTDIIANYFRVIENKDKASGFEGLEESSWEEESPF